MYLLHSKTFEQVRGGVPQANKFEQVHVWSHGDSPQTDRLTDTTENITLPYVMHKNDFQTFLIADCEAAYQFDLFYKFTYCENPGH